MFLGGKMPGFRKALASKPGRKRYQSVMFSSDLYLIDQPLPVTNIQGDGK